MTNNNNNNNNNNGMDEVTLSSIKKNSLTERDVKDIADSVNGGFYRIQTSDGKTKRVPDARLFSSLSNAKKISIEIIETIKTGEYAKAHVRAITTDGHYREAEVVHNYRDVMQDKLLSMIKTDKEEYTRWCKFPVNKDKKWSKGFFHDLHNPFTIDESGNMLPDLSLWGKKKIVKDMIQFKKTAERDATTKAETMAIKKLLNQEWREKEEQESELNEVKSVNKIS
jgi:hypothetical protein